MADHRIEHISDKHHRAFDDWQKAEFPELHLLTDNWEKYFKGQTPFQLCAKVGELRSEHIEYGRFKGRKRIEQARRMSGNMFYSAKGIIRAQCSTELGSIQQHRESLDSAISDEAQYCILRVMAEELRHAYQMFWVLDSDKSWKRPGHGDAAKDTIDELLSMRTGDHVLDAFNIEFGGFLDNSVFAAIIDLVGKYQLDMQRAFSYAPMARSMGPMFSEEGFHLATGRRLVKQIAGDAARERGDFSLDDIQRAFNTWFPRGCEMFGNEEGGTTNVEFSFKDRMNGTAQDQYVEEVRGIILDANAEIVGVRMEKASRKERREIARRVMTTREAQDGVRPEDLLYLPSKRFNRKRGPESCALEPIDVNGETITESGAPVAGERYFTYLEGKLTPHYVRSAEFDKFKADWAEKRETAAAAW